MKSVGIKILKNKLSSYLKAVRRGEVILVTDRNEVIAEIRQPAKKGGREVSRLDLFLSEAAERGVLIPPHAESPLVTLPAKPPVCLEVEDLLAETRRDRL